MLDNNDYIKKRPKLTEVLTTYASLYAKMMDRRFSIPDVIGDC